MLLNPRIRQLKVKWKPTASRVVKTGYYLTGAILIVFVGLSPIFLYNSSLAGSIGDYLSGAGQVIILVWIVVTFWLQRADLYSQQDEQDRQDKSLQQRNILLIYHVHIEHLGTLISRFIEKSAKEVGITLSELKPLGQPDNAFLAHYILNSNSLIDYLSNHSSDENHFSSVFCERYVSRFENLKTTITDVDISNHLYDALISETDYLDLYFLIKSLSNRS